MKTYLFSGIAASLLSASPVLAGEQQVSIDVSEMICPTCSYTVASSMRSVPSVQVVDFQESDTFGEGVFVVTFDDETTSADVIVSSVNAIGYPARLHVPSGS